MCSHVLCGQVIVTNDVIGVTVVDIDECLITPSVCGLNSICKNKRGSYKCRCQKGYKPAPTGVGCVGKCSLCKLCDVVAILQLSIVRLLFDGMYWIVVLKLFCSSRLLRYYCHPDYVCQLVRFVRQANLSYQSFPC